MKASSTLFILVMLVLGAAFEGRGQSPLPTPQRWYEVMEQRNCPIKFERRVTKFKNGEETAILDLQLSGKKPVRAVVIYLNGTSRHNVLTKFYPEEGLRAGGNAESYFWDNLSQDGEKVEVSIDYTLFTDGTNWGPDSLRHAGRINEYLEGRKAAIENLTTILYGIVQDDYLKGINRSIDVIYESIGDHEPTKPGLSFQERGYEMVLNGLQGGVELKDIKTKLRAMEKHPSP